MAPLSRNAVVLVTAGSAGLGAATAKAFAASGVRVIVNYYSSPQKAAGLIKEMESLQPKAENDEFPRFIAIQADVSKRDEILKLVNESVEKMGKIDAVVSNHGWTRLTNFQNLDDNVREDDWDTCFNYNVKSHLFLFHTAKPYLEKSEGSFTSVASVAGTKPSGSSIAYSVTKAAQIHLMKTLATISGPHIRVNSISPGLLLTEWGQKFPKEKIDKAINKSVLKKVATVEDCASQIVCFANSSTQTGTNAIIDAGVTLG
ncbi:hypothetical protein HYALB_00012805 [Hymenoscyphus albidus]|uniref:Uncharacterized protein n=1 Tax=Hymenoscyphus albidus TaxID=595503 RepID=A0A9N9LTX7_9HELO|nr:hypothetical protein HYALB_00012805 [Hymenoscyphus albidus]